MRWIIEKQESSRKTSVSSLLTMPKPLNVWITINCAKFERHGNTRPPDLPLEKPVCKSGSNSLNWTWDNRLVQLGKGVLQGCILSPCSFNLNEEYIMRNAGLEEAQLESRFPAEISITSDMQMTPPLWQKVKRN